MLERIFNFINDASKSFFSFLKILIKSNLFVPKQAPLSDNCIILGNGPSLKNVLNNHSEQLKNQTLLCVNNFPATPAFEVIKPSYFLFTSKEFWIPNSIKKHQDVRDNIIKSLVEKTTWPITVYCPFAANKSVKFVHYIKSNPSINLVFFNDTPVEGLSFFNNFFMKMGWGLPRPHNVLIPSIFCITNTGYKKILLIGADHSWLPLVSVNDKNVALVNQKHFYDEGQTKSTKMHKNSQARKLHEILEKFMLAFRAYFVLDAYATTEGTKIYNCTPGSFIDAFDRENIEIFL